MQNLIGMLNTFKDKYLYWFDIPKFNHIDFVEIIIISFLVYNILVWVKNTRAWTLLKGIIVIVLFCTIAAVFQMNTILWIIGKTLNVMIMAVIVVFQPELRRALESLGRKNFLMGWLKFDTQKNQVRFSDKTLGEITKATFEMAKVKTGALIVIEQDVKLTEYERTGIMLDSLVSSQLLINIFEHNTPLHDGAVIVHGNRISSATCYLPLSDNMQLSKELGTRHRAGVGISEATDAMTLIVSEETGKISVAYKGELTRNLKAEDIEKQLQKIQNKPTEEKKRRILNINRSKSK